MQHFVFDALQTGCLDKGIHIGLQAVTLVQFGGQPQGAERGKTAVIEGVREAEAANARTFPDELGQLFFQQVEGGHMRFLFALLGLRFGKGFHIHFLIDIQRNGVNLQGDGRHHVRGLFPGNEGVQFLNVHFLLAHYIGGQEFAAARAGLIKSLYGNILDAGEFPDDGFHFLQFDAETANLHLAVFPAHKFYLSIGALAHNVTGAVHACIIRLFVEGIREEGFGRLVGPVQISVAHLPAGNPQFSIVSGLHLLAVFVHDISMDAGERNADGDVLFLLLHFFADDVADALCGPVAVEQPVMGKREGGHFFAAGVHDFQPFAVRIVDGKLGSHLGGHEAVRDAVILEELVQGRKIQAYFFRNDVQRCTRHQRSIQVSYKGIEAETGVGRHTGIPRDAGVGGVVLGKERHVAVRNHAALGRAGGAAGVEQDKEVFRCGLGRWLSRV